MKDLSTISSDLFNKIRSRFSDIKIGDKTGALTDDESQARFFDVNYKVADKVLGRINIKIDDDALTVIYSTDMLDGAGDAKNDWFNFLKDLRQFARSNLLKFDTRDITKSNLDKRDYKYLSKESGEKNMSESKLFGTSKTSFQDMGEAKIIVRHSAPVNLENPAGRTQRIESIYIESANGERFRYPTRHLNGARAMATHVANGGNPYDGIGSYITGLSEEIGKLRQFKNYTSRSGVMAEAMGDVSTQVVERIDQIKIQIAALQRQQYYETFAESFAPNESVEVPEDVMQGWVDALTVKTFNEELTSVFPYIYRLVKEKQEQGLSYSDLVQEGTCPSCKADPCECDDVEETVDMFDEFEQQVDELATTGYEKEVAEDPNEGNEFANIVQKLKAQGVKPGTKFKTSDGEEHTLKDAIEMGGMQVTDFWTTEELQNEGDTDSNRQSQSQNDNNDDIPFSGPYKKSTGVVTDKSGAKHSGMSVARHLAKQAIPKEVVEFIASMYDSDSGTFPRGEEGVKIACEKKFGEQAGQFANYVVEKLSGQGMAEGNRTQLSIQQLAAISDEALDKAYQYGRSSPGNTFGYQANLKSAAFAKQMIDKGVTDIEEISDAIHKGWNTTAQAFVKDPDQFDDTAKLKAAGKLEAKLQQRAQLMKQNYAQLPEEEKEKDRVVARALLQAIKGQQGVAEGPAVDAYMAGKSPAIAHFADQLDKANEEEDEQDKKQSESSNELARIRQLVRF